MKTKRQQIEELKESISNIDLKACELQDEAAHLREKRDTIVSEVILEEELLANTNWEIRTFDNDVYLQFVGKLKDERFASVIDVVWNGWHSWFNLEPEVQIRFDDAIVTLNFDDPKLVIPFVKKHKLKVTGQTLVDRMRELKRELSALEAINHQFNLKG
jgi:hypothetical protein